MLDTDDKKEIKKPCRSHAVFCSIFLKGGSSPVHILFFFLEHVEELLINILRKKRGIDPQSVTDIKDL